MADCYPTLVDRCGRWRGRPTPPPGSVLAGLLAETLDLLGGLALGDVGGDLLAGLTGERVEVALLRGGDRVAAGHPLARVLLQGRVPAAGGAEHLPVVLGGRLDLGGLLGGGLAGLGGELALGCG